MNYGTSILKIKVIEPPTFKNTPFLMDREENLGYDSSPMHIGKKKTQASYQMIMSRPFDNKTLCVKTTKISSHIKHQITFSTETPSQEEGSNIKEFLLINNVF